MMMKRRRTRKRRGRRIEENRWFPLITTDPQVPDGVASHQVIQEQDGAHPIGTSK